MSRVAWSVLFVSALLTVCLAMPTVAQSEPNEVQKLLASDGKAGDDFGRSVAVQDNLAFVGAQRADVGANTDQGQVYMYELDSDEQWIEAGVLRASDGAASDTFGYELALDGDWLAVTALGDENYRGSVYMFQRQESGDWLEMQKITPSNGQSFDYFGVGLDLWQDRLIAGASGDRDKGNVAGSAYIYELIDGTWSEVAFLLPDELEAFDIFGEDVAIAGDIAVVGAQGDDDDAANSGAVYIYERVTSTEMNSESSNLDALQVTVGLEGTAPGWAEAGKLKSQTPNLNDSFGFAVAVLLHVFAGFTPKTGFNLDNGIIIVGAPGADNLAENGGAVEQWTKKAGGEAEFQGVISEGTTPNAELGLSLATAWRDDGLEIVTLGSHHECKSLTGGINVGSGSNQVTEFTETDTWTGSDVGEWGSAIDSCLYLKGNTAYTFVSEPGNDDTGEDAGAVHIFENILPEVDQGDLQVQKLLASDGKAGDDFGRSVAVQDTIAFIGASRVDIGGNTDQGQVYIFEFMPDEQWVETGVLRASNGVASDTFGYRLALDGDWLAVTAFGSENSTGSVYMFQRQENGDWIEMQKLIPSNGESFDYFGHGIDLWQDRLIVGAAGDRDRGTVAGSAYIYELINETWTEVAFLLPDELETFDLFGKDVAILGDLAVVGAEGDDDAAANAGAVYIYERDSSTHLYYNEYKYKWTSGSLPNPHVNDMFGYAVDLVPGLSNDTIVVVGVPGADNLAENGGAVERWSIPDVGTGGEVVYLGVIYEGTTPDNEAGKSIATAALDDGTTIIVAGGNADEAGGGTGVVTLKDREVVNTDTVIGSDAVPEDDFGRAVATNYRVDDLNYDIDVFVSAPGDDDNGEDAGAVYVFEDVGSLIVGQQSATIPAQDRVPPPDDLNLFAGYDLKLYEIIDPAWHNAPIADLQDKLTDDTVAQIIGTGTSPVINFGDGDSGFFHCPMDNTTLALTKAGLAHTVFDEEECDPDLRFKQAINGLDEYERTNNPLILQALRKINLTSSDESTVLVTDAKEDVMQVGSKQLNGADLPDAQNPSGLQAYSFRPEEPGWYDLTHTIKVPILDFSLELFELTPEGIAVLVGQKINQVAQTISFGPCGPGVADRDGDGIEDSIDVLPDEPSKGFFHTAASVNGEIKDLRGNKICIRPLDDSTVRITVFSGGEDAGDTVLIQLIGIELELDVGTELDAAFG